jgi:hypothetical protein
MLSRGRGRSRWLLVVQDLRSLQALSKQVKVSEEIQLTAFSGIGRGCVRSEGPEGHFTAMFILANGRVTGQQVFWNGSGRVLEQANNAIFEAFWRSSQIFPLTEQVNSSSDHAASGVGRLFPRSKTAQ